MVVPADLKTARFQSIYLSLIAGLLACSSTLQLSGSLPSLVELLFIIFSTYVSYQAARWQPRLSLKNFSFQFKKAPSPAILIGLLTCWLVLLFLIPSSKFYFVIVLVILTLLYFTSWGPSGIERQGLRSIPLIKNILLAGAWSVSTVWLPLDNHYGERATVYLLTGRFIYILTISLGFDLRDMISDRRQHLRTLPVLFGFNKVRLTCLILMLIFILMTLFPAPSFLIPYRTISETNWLAFSALLTGLGILFLRPQTPARIYTMFLDGNLALQALILIILRYGR